MERHHSTAANHPSTFTFTQPPLRTLQGKFPNFPIPTEIGSFSQDSEKRFQNDRSQLRYYCPPPPSRGDIGFNLREGYDAYRMRDDSSIKDDLDDFLRWINLNGDKLRRPELEDKTRIFPDFICWRGLLTTLFCTPYETQQGWKIAVTLYNGTYYMIECDTEQRLRQKQQQAEAGTEEAARQSEMFYWGYKFEQYVTSDKPPNEGGMPNTTLPVNSNEAFYSVVSTKLNKHSLAFSAEVDCCDETGDNLEYVELKTSKHPNNYNRGVHGLKRMKWWAQSFLMGIPKTVCGLRDNSGIVLSLQYFYTSEIQKNCRDMRWDASVCANFCDKVLQFIKERVTKDNPRIAYVFERTPGGDITGEEFPPDSQYSVLPSWFYNPQ